ncbi:DNA polymerase III subunit delta [Patescibacteria group bacterium]|nr:DNA polymerase III subunit delta [Patescibacteria group bacterium]MBU4274378.1 DNA polymerase III subunit delta [Patescibacteria group bacterium]MBU4367514.1 DNA polymerase III subunit delta [Patescibacteria group bacterium]MBU4461555.1 DNA polymerase III subunit delta [Patescibacteria group bacterium]MCG2699452.1 DNA polymerase III subunit delta [Candidatus Parcubacteria bacterium]
MIIFLYGPDSYRSRQKLEEVLAHYNKTHKSGLNLRFFDCEEKNVVINDLKDKIQQTSIFKEKKLTIIANLFTKASLKEEFQKEIKTFLDSEDIIVIYEKENIKKGDKLLKVLNKNAKSQEFKLLEGQNLRNWVKKEVEKQNGAIDPNALGLLINYIGDDLWRMANEIQKLVNFKRNKIITAADIKLLVKNKIETDIFKTIDAIAQKNKKQALNLLYQHLENGDSPLYLLSMIGYQFRNLLTIKELMEKNKPYGLIIQKSGLHPFVVKKSYYQAGQFTFSELKKIYQKIFQVDFDVKTGKIEQEMALDLLVAGM